MEKSGGRKVMDEIRSFEKASLFDLGHPLLNRVADSFVKAAAVGALQAVSREAYFTVVDGTGFDSSSMGPPSEDTGSKKHRFPNLRGENNSKSLEALVKNTGKESLQWGLAAGLYSGITYGMKEARGGAHDWTKGLHVMFVLKFPHPTTNSKKSFRRHTSSVNTSPSNNISLNDGSFESL
ncbi:hypothetical protein F2Q68_00030530 [Brassica cretica]|uniref:Outer envelope pore protein 16-2, chloroplastic n=1 Tax=Brassica cretica TaxID=69181 RepID=A0A8S9G9M3_BRACR|nr:hypothetical protein F2Q68_00030530 [Brassica cretica]